MLRKVWKILWISTLSFIAFFIIVATLVHIFVPEEELKKASAPETVEPAAPPPVEYKTVNWPLTPEEQGLKVGDWITAQGQPGGYSGALRQLKGENHGLDNIDPLSGAYFLRMLPNSTLQAFELSYFADAGDVTIMATKSPLPPNIKTSGVRVIGIPNHDQHPIITQANLLKLHEMEHVTEIIVHGQISRISPPFKFDGYPRQTIWVDDVGCTLKLTATPEQLASAMAQAKANAAVVKQKFEQLKSQFLGWGFQLQHWNTMEYIQSRMHNPKSFKHVRTTFTTNEAESYRLIDMKYRGTNVYNAIVTNTIRVKVTLDGNVIGVVSDQ